MVDWLDGRVDGSMEENLLGIICKHFEGHGMANMFSKANKATTIFLGLRWKTSRLPMSKINGLPEISIKAY